eukprot:956847-Pyramimonas_sp.AAC.1
MHAQSASSGLCFQGLEDILCIDGQAERVSAALRGVRAARRSWDSSPPSCGLLQVVPLTSPSGPASGETCSTRRQDGRRAHQQACPRRS